MADTWLIALPVLLLVLLVVAFVIVRSRKPEGLAKMKEQVYEDERPAAHFTKYHRRARTKKPNWVYTMVRLVVVTISIVFFRIRIFGAENVPKTGRVIIAPNHFSYMDHFFVGKGILPRRVRFMAKSQIFKWPLSLIYSHGGVFPVRRGQKDQEAIITGRMILECDELLVMYIQGGRSRTGEVDGKPHSGIGRYVLTTGAPVVPTAIHGSSHVRNWRRLQFPEVTVMFGQVMRWDKVENPTREQCQEVADAVFAEIQALYAKLEKTAPMLRERK